jgi:hypothetical protein
VIVKAQWEGLDFGVAQPGADSGIPLEQAMEDPKQQTIYLIQAL